MSETPKDLCTEVQIRDSQFLLGDDVGSGNGADDAGCDREGGAANESEVHAAERGCPICSEAKDQRHDSDSDRLT